MDARLDPRRVRDIYQDITGMTDVVSSVHKNNLNTEMIFDEFLEALVRAALVVRLGKGDINPAIIEHLRAFVDDFVFRHCQTKVPGKF